MLPRVLEPEVMDTPEEARNYDAMDHATVNNRFVADFLDAHGPCREGEILDIGTGPAQIPIALCRADLNAQVLGIDLAEAMLERARYNISKAGLDDRIRCLVADAKNVGTPYGTFEAVISNTIIHHIPEPGPVLAEAARMVAPGGTLFIRDLARPDNLDEVARLLLLHAGTEPPAARALFEASLHAALTLDEVRGLVAQIGLPPESVTMTSDRHWTWIWRRPDAN